MPSEPGADKVEHLLRAYFTSSGERAGALGSGVSYPLGRVGGFRGKEVFEEDGVDGCRGVGPWEGQKSGGFVGDYVLFSRPDVLRGGLGQKVRPVCTLGSFDRLEVSQP